MTLLFIDGFDDGLFLSKWSAYNNTFIEAGGRTLNKLKLVDNSDTSVRKTVSNADEHATFIIGFALKLTQSQNACNMVGFASDAVATQHIAVGVNTNNAIVVYRGPCSTLLGTTANNTVTPGIWSYVEIKITLSDTVGVVGVVVDGVTQLNLTNQDTKNGGTKTVLESVTFAASSGPVGTEFAIDDFYLCNGAGTINNTFLGDCTVLTRYPDGNGNYSQGVNSAATSVNNYSYVDETTPSAVDYVAFATTGIKDTYTFQDIPAGTVYGVQQAMYAAKADAGTRTMRNIQRMGVTDYVGVDQALGVAPGYAAKLDMLQVSPATGVLWTTSEVNSTEFGTEARP